MRLAETGEGTLRKVVLHDQVWSALLLWPYAAWVTAEAGNAEPLWRVPLVRIEPIRQAPVRTGYGAMRGTVALLVPEDELIRGSDSTAWRTLEEWEEATRS
jgi:hypothetical protein